MDTSHEIAAFCEGVLGPGQIKLHTEAVQKSGLTIPILGFLHIGRPEIEGQFYGDLIYNDYPADLLVSKGQFNQKLEAWPKQVAQLKQNSSVKRIFISIGGDGLKPANVRDFRTIQDMIENGQDEILRKNLEKLRGVFTFNNACVIDGIDLNCEEFYPYLQPDGPPYVEDSTIVKFSTMLFELGFEVTFNPWAPVDRKRWQDCMLALWNKGHKVSWWNLQCFDGGYDNRCDLQTWIDSLATVVGKDKAASYLMPGLSVKGAKDGQCPSTNNWERPCQPTHRPDKRGIQETFAGWRNLGLRGGWLWNYDNIVANAYPGLCPNRAYLVDYVHAVKNGLGGTA
jgi:hypothetical protein